MRKRMLHMSTFLLVTSLGPQRLAAMQKQKGHTSCGWGTACRSSRPSGCLPHTVFWQCDRLRMGVHAASAVPAY